MDEGIFGRVGEDSILKKAFGSIGNGKVGTMGRRCSSHISLLAPFWATRTNTYTQKKNVFINILRLRQGVIFDVLH
jgi:hypothetical protein